MLDRLHIAHEVHWYWAEEFATKDKVIIKQVLVEPRSSHPRPNYYLVGSNKEYTRLEFQARYRLLDEVKPAL